jgi:hypothetical protein
MRNRIVVEFMTIRFRTSLAPLVVALTLVSCASDSLPDRTGAPPPMMSQGEEGRSRADSLFPPPNWWHDDVASAVALDGDQLKRLDALQEDQGAEIARLERDLMLSVRDVRSAFDQAQPADDQVTSSGERRGSFAMRCSSANWRCSPPRGRS